MKGDSSKGDVYRKRRRFLSMIGVTASSGAAFALPEKWSRPVVNSLLLPAHAQTSEAVSPEVGGGDTTTNPPIAPPPACAPLSIPGVTQMCLPAPIVSPGPVEVALFFVDDSGACPVLAAGSPPGPTPLLKILRVTTQVPGQVGNTNASVNVQIGGDMAFSNYNCASMTAGLGLGNFTKPFLSSSGAVWDASYSLTDAGGGIILSDITLTRR